ncbi:MAG: hypothetical protein ACPGQL_06425 [Thermoplasmatota archaeon]
MLSRMVLLLLVAPGLAGCLDQTPAPQEVYGVVAVQDGPAFEERSLRLFADHSDVMAEGAPGGGSSGYIVNCGLVFSCEWLFHWREGRIGLMNGTTGQIQIAPSTDAAPLVDVAAQLVADGAVVAEVEQREIGYVNPFFVHYFAPTPAIVLPFEIEPYGSGPVNITLRVTMEATSILPGMTFHDDWQYATGIEFDNVRVYENTNSTSRWI